MHRLISSVMTGALALVLLGSHPVHAESDHADHDHQTVRISGGRIHPEHVNLGADDALAWANYSSRIARVVFDAEVAERMKCRSATSFTLAGDRLVSRDIQASQFASLCQLAPGEYSYKTELYSGSGSSGFAGVDRTLQGRITVK